MSKHKPILLLMIAAMLGLLATTAAARYLEKQGGPAASKTKVFVAAAELLPGTRITREVISEMPWPGDEAPESLITVEEDALDRYVAISIAPGEPLVKNKLSDTSLAGSLTGYIPPGYRAMAIKIDRSVKAGGLLEPGCYVDVLTVMTQRGRVPVSKIILQNVKVLSVGVRKTNPEDDESSKSSGTLGVDEVVTLLLRPAEAEKLAFAMTRGKIQVMARGTADRAEVETAGFSSEAFLDTEQPPQPAAPPAPVEAAPEPEKPDHAAQVLFAKARALEDSGDLAGARTLYNRISDEYTGCEFAVKAVERLREIAERLEEKLKLDKLEKGLAAAREMLDKGLFDECRKKVAELIEQCGSMEYRGQEVADILSNIKLKAEHSEKRARIDFQLFTNWLNNGNLDQARLCLKKMAKKYPESAFHRKAAEMMKNAEMIASADKAVKAGSNHETEK